MLHELFDLALTTTIPIWATTMKKIGCCQLEAKVNRASMARLLPILASPPSQTKKGFVGRLSYELNNMCLANMNMACFFCLILQAIETSFNEGCIIKGDEITRGGV
jgi:hypothetical protein